MTRIIGTIVRNLSLTKVGEGVINVRDLDKHEDIATAELLTDGVWRLVEIRTGIMIHLVTEMDVMDYIRRAYVNWR